MYTASAFYIRRVYEVSQAHTKSENRRAYPYIIVNLL